MDRTPQQREYRPRKKRMHGAPALMDSIRSPIRSHSSDSSAFAAICHAGWNHVTHSPGKIGEPPRRQAPTLRMTSPAEHEHTLISCSKRLPGFPRLPGLSVLEFFKEKGGYSPFPAQTFVGNARAMTQPLHPRPRHWKLVQLAAPSPRPCITSTYRLPSPEN